MHLQRYMVIEDADSIRMEDVPADDLIKTIFDVEKLGDEIVSDQHSIVEMDRIRNKNREALGSLRRPSPLMVREEQVWMNVGNLFVRMPKEGLVKNLEEDQKYLDGEIEKTRKNLKPKVTEMNRALGKPELQGFDLEPLTKAESEVMRMAIGPRV